MKKKTVITLLLAIVTLVSCGSSEPEYADPEAHERNVQLNEQYGPLVAGSWHYETISDTQRYFERLSFQADGTLTGMRKWQTRKAVTIDGEKPPTGEQSPEAQRYTDWKDVGLSGSFSGTWELRYWSPDGGEKRNCLQLFASYDSVQQDFMAYSCVLTFAYADATTLRIQGYYVKAPDGWVNYQRGEAEPSF